MFEHGVQEELRRLKWANETYERDLARYVSALEGIHNIIHTVPIKPESAKGAIAAILEAINRI